jgi:hypothetical protein
MHKLATIAAKVLCLIIWASASIAQDALDSAITDRLTDAVLADGMPELRNFALEHNLTIYSNPNLGRDELEPYQVTIGGQLSARITFEFNEFQVLRLEDCGTDLGNYGIPHWVLDDDTVPSGLIDKVRINAALERAGIDIELTSSDAQNLRNFTGTDWQIGDTPIHAYPALQKLNETLFDLYEAGGASVPHQIVDPSWGCGAGEIEVEIRSDPPLAAIHMIPELYFSVCEDNTSDPWDKTQCRWWTPSPEVGLVSGAYAYQGITAEGETRRGKISIDLRDTGDALEKPVIVLR